MKLCALWAAIVAVGITGACSSETSDDPPDDPTGPVEDFPEVPDKPDDAIEYHFPEVTIPAGSERQHCFYLEPTEEEMYFRRLDSYQGQFGHHLIFFRTLDPKPAGTLRDCTEAADMSSLLPVMSSVNFGLEEFPEGMAIRVEKGTQLVIQQHYLNTTDNPIVVRDTLHVYHMAKESVQTLAGFYGLSDIGFEIPTGATDHVIEFSCTAPQDMKLLLMGPHMHEWGTQFTAEVESEGAVERILDIPRWEAWMRDDPPVAEWTPEDALEIKQGSAIRTRCVFDNSGDHELIFPEEMCSTYGYFFPAQVGADIWVCGG